jgi:uncharacterized protein with NRDE domain
VCTLALFFRMLPDCALLIAANRDEHYDRPTASPAEVAASPKVFGGRDLRSGGTWLGVNEHGVLAAILNRRINSDEGALRDRRSRGLLCMDLLGLPSASEGAVWLRSHNTEYNPFTLLVADRDQAHVTYNSGSKLVTKSLQPGLHVFSSAAEFDLHSRKADRAYDLFGAVAQRFGERHKEWRSEAVGALHRVLGDHSLPPGSSDPGDAICVHRESSGTVSSSIAMLSPSGSRFDFFHCSGAPCRNEFASPLELKVR